MVVPSGSVLTFNWNGSYSRIMPLEQYRDLVKGGNY